MREILMAVLLAAAAASCAAEALNGEQPASEPHALADLASNLLTRDLSSALPPGFRRLVRRSANRSRPGGAAVDAASSYHAGHGGRSLLSSSSLDPMQLARDAAQQSAQGQPINTTGLVIAADTLFVISSAIGLASGIVSDVFGSLATAQASITVVLADYTRKSARANFFLSEYAFGSRLYSDFSAHVTSSDYLGDAAKHVRLWNQIQAELANAGIGDDLQGNMQQLASAQAIVQAIPSTEHS